MSTLTILKPDSAGDYRVVVKSGGKLAVPGEDGYYTPDFDDAWGTANDMLKRRPDVSDARPKWARDKASRMKLSNRRRKKNPSRRWWTSTGKGYKYKKRKWRLRRLRSAKKVRRASRGTLVVTNPGRSKPKILKWVLFGVAGYVLYKLISKTGDTLAQKVIVGPRL